MLSSDEWSQLIRLVRGIIDEQASVVLATVTSYDAATHTVRCTLQPGGHKTGALPGPAAHQGEAHPLRAGQQGLVARVGGVPVSFFSLAHSPDDMPPSSALSLEGDLFASGNGTFAGGLTLIPGELLPTASAATDGQVLSIKPTDGSAPAKLYWCGQSVDGTYHWTLLSAAP